MWEFLEDSAAKIKNFLIVLGVIPATLFFVWPGAERFVTELFGVRAYYFVGDFRVFLVGDATEVKGGYDCTPPKPVERRQGNGKTGAQSTRDNEGRICFSSAHPPDGGAYQTLAVHMRASNFHSIIWQNGKMQVDGCDEESIDKKISESKRPAQHPWEGLERSHRSYACTIDWINKQLEGLIGQVIYASVSAKTNPVPGRAGFTGTPRDPQRVISVANFGECFRVLRAWKLGADKKAGWPYWIRAMLKGQASTGYWDTTTNSESTYSTAPHNITLRMVKTPCL